MCGLFGYIGKDNKRFSWDKFNLLGLFNDSRGGDSCGRYLLGQVTYGVEKRKLYRDLVLSLVNDYVTKENGVVLGHCRKATVGAHTEKNAQPVVLLDEENKGNTDIEEDFVMIHNGTLINHEELADKYGIKEFKDDTDSKILAKLIKKEGFKVLTEYIGAAAIVVFDIREWKRTGDQVVYIFRRKSKNYATSANAEDERPLYLYEIDTNYWYFSSLEESLVFIDGYKDKKDRITEVEPNQLYKFVNGTLVSKTPYDRTECLQKKPYASTTQYYGRDYGYNLYGGYGDDWEDDVAYGRYYQELNKWGKDKDCKTKEKDADLPTVTFPAKHAFEVDIDKESLSLVTTSTSNMVSFVRGRYYKNERLLTGKVKMSKYGYVSEPKYTNDYEAEFLEGVMLFPGTLELAKTLYTLTGDIKYVFPFAMESFVYVASNMFARYDFGLKKLITPSGYFSPLFSLRSYLVIKGDCTKYRAFTGKSDIGDIEKRVGMCKFYTNLLCNRVSNLMPSWLKTQESDFANLKECIEYYWGEGEAWDTFQKCVVENFNDMLLTLKSESYHSIEACKYMFEAFISECSDLINLDELKQESQEIIDSFNVVLKKLD